MSKEMIYASAKRLIALLLTIAFCISLTILSYGVVVLGMTQYSDILSYLLIGTLATVAGYIGVSWLKDNPFGK
jgi:hypothetical protein